MNTEQNKIKRDVSSVLWVVLFIFLSLSALFLASYYVYMMVDSANINTDDELQYKLWDASPSEYRFNSVSDSSVLPTLIYFQNQESGAALLNNESLTKEYYGDLKRYITEGFTGASFEIYYGDERSVIENSILGSSCVYFKFPTELPLYLFLYYMDNKIPEDVLENEYYLSYVDSFFIVRQDDGDGYYIAAASDKIIITSGSKTEILFPVELVDTVLNESSLNTNAEFFDAEFTRKTSGVETAPFAVSINKDLYTSRIVSSEKFSIRSSKTAVDAVLTLFGYNPDKVSSYKESKNVDVYVETFGLLRLSDTGIVFEASADAGIDLGDYKMIQNEVSLFDAVCVSDGFIESVSEVSDIFMGGDAEPRLSSVTYNEGVLSVSYMYYYDNIPISGAKAAEFSFTEGKLTGAVINSLNIENSLTRDILSGSGLLYKLYGKSDSIKDSYLDLSYLKNGTELSAEWIIYK